ncbi:MAG: hypothetical protein EXS16_16810 [Gemmataceae bacterium]|nr:hypothetical protein [Gemmataceae bacterium]
MDTALAIMTINQIPPTERVGIVADLWDQLVDDGFQPELDSATAKELDARWTRFKADPTTGSTWSEVVAFVKRDRP